MEAADQTNVLLTLWQQLNANSIIELIAVIGGIAYLLLVVKENIWCWFAAAISTVIFLYVFWQAKLYMESGLQVYYLFMAGYGYQQWQNSNANDELHISTWRWQTHVLCIAGIIISAFLSGYALSYFTDAKLPYIDSFTTWGAIVTTYMVTKKVLENWLYWLVIDGISIYLYLDRGLYFTSLLFAVYILIVIHGLYTWTIQYKHQQKLSAAP